MKKTLLILSILIYNINNAQIVNIPDTNFKNKLLSGSSSNFVAQNLNGDYFDIDLNNDNEIQVSEAQNVSYLDLTFSNISNLIGIEEFVNITSLNCDNNNLTSLDLSYNPNLTLLKCSTNQLNSLDISSNINLITLICENNSLNSLNLNNNSELVYLNCGISQLSTLDLSNNPNLVAVGCYNNPLIDLEICNNHNLTYLNCHDTQLSTLNLNNQSVLTSLYCGNNSNLTYINLNNSNNQNLDVSNNSHFINLPNLQDVCVDELNTDLTAHIEAQTGHSINFSTDCIIYCPILEVKETDFLLFSVYPIPVNNILNVKSKTKISKIEIYNKIGQLILLNENKNNIDISNLASDLYFIKVKDINENFGLKKIVKN